MTKDLKSLLKAACSRGRLNKTINNRDEHFIMSDVDSVIAEREKANKNNACASKVIVKNDKKEVEKVTEKRVFKSASLNDILGFNPKKTTKAEATKEADNVPEKWRKHYDKMLHIKELLQKGSDVEHTEEDEILLELISNPQEVLQEIEAAIKRIFDGTYGICEITGEPILPERLDSIPYTRYSLEGQKQVEEAKRMRLLAQMANTQRISEDEDIDNTPKSPFYEDNEDEALEAELEE